MHGSFEKSDENFKTVRSVYQNWGIGVFVLPIMIVIALIGMAMTNQGASNWISDAVQAEFVGTDLVPNLAPTQLAQPKEIRSSKAN